MVSNPAKQGRCYLGTRLFVLGTFGLLCARIGHVIGSSHEGEILGSGVGLTRSTRRFQKGTWQ